MSLPILYSFRRCPYAIRARMAILLSDLQVIIREVKLSDKPESLLVANPKGTVPVLVNGKDVISESIDIMLWAFAQGKKPVGQQKSSMELIKQCDQIFKPFLDRYKYPVRFGLGKEDNNARTKGLQILIQWNHLLSKSQFLLSDQPSLADMAIFPFVRQFINVNPSWFLQQNLEALATWLDYWLNSSVFSDCMKKYAVWYIDQKPQLFP